MSWDSSTDAKAQKDCVKEALWDGTYAGAGAAFVSGLLLGAANRLSPTFRNALGPSGRAAMVTLPALGACFLQIEWTINTCAQRRSRSPGAPKPAEKLGEPEDILPRRSG